MVQIQDYKFASGRSLQDLLPRDEVSVNNKILLILDASYHTNIKMFFHVVAIIKNMMEKHVSIATRYYVNNNDCDKVSKFIDHLEHKFETSTDKIKKKQYQLDYWYASFVHLSNCNGSIKSIIEINNSFFSFCVNLPSIYESDFTHSLYNRIMKELKIFSVQKNSKCVSNNVFCVSSSLNPASQFNTDICCE